MKLIVLSLLVIFTFICLEECSAANILLLYTIPSKSHLVVVQSLTKELAKRGHKITEFSAFPLEKNYENYRHIEVPMEFGNEDSYMKNLLKDSGNMDKMRDQFFDIVGVFLTGGNATLNHPELKKMMAEESFDLVITGFIANSFFVGIAEHFDCPVVIMSLQPPSSFINVLVGNPVAASGVPHFFLNKKSIETILGKVKNVLIYAGEYIVMSIVDWKSKQLYDENFPADKYVSYREALKRVSLVLTNHHFSQGAVRPNVPAMVEVGGLQAKTKPSPLPENIKKFMDEAENGVIFFSLGSNIKGTYLSEKTIDVLIKTFSKLKQRVIWKWESDDLPGKPNNVLIGKWLPQDDILAHKNVKLFISHGGLGSVVESMYHAVPIVGMPIFGDQMGNVDAIVNEGWAVSVPLKTLNEKDLTDAIREVLGNPKYTSTVKKLSELYRDRPSTAMETAVYWTEYVIRHRGAKHMRYPAADLNYFQYYSLDVFAFIFATLYIFFKIVKLAFRLVKRKICSKKSKHVKFDMHLKIN